MTNQQKTSRPNEPTMPEPLAYFLTWTTYGTWLPGDERGWVLRGKGFQPPAPIRQESAEKRMTESACTLSEAQRAIVANTIADHCRIRGWHLHAVNCRSNHIHVVVTASDRSPEDVRDQFKAWCTRKLKVHHRNTSPTRQQGNNSPMRQQGNTSPTRQRGNTTHETTIRQKWWTEKGSERYIGDEQSLEAVINYVLDAQDRKDRDPSPQRKQGNTNSSPQREQGNSNSSPQREQGNPNTNPSPQCEQGNTTNNVDGSVPSLARRAGVDATCSDGGVE